MLGDTNGNVSGQPLVRMEGLRKSYDGRTLVIDDLNLDIGRGEFLTLLGPSGSGKTTTLMMLAGFERPSAGRILLEGRSIEGLPPHSRNIGVVFQNYALFPHMTVFDNIAFPLSVRREPKEEIASRVAKALAMVELEAFGGRMPGQLSGGQQQRVALARALVFEPHLVLMDEPLGALDKRLREQMQIEIKNLHRSLGLTIVYVTHDQTEAMVLSDRIAVFNGGRIQQLDTPRIVHERPANGFVAQFMGETNAFNGTVVGTVADGIAKVSLDNGLVLEGHGSEVRAGESKLVAVRPERIRLDPPQGSVENRFPVTVTDLLYLGGTMVLKADLSGLPIMINPGIESTDNPPDVGSTITIGWSKDHCLVLDRD